MSEALRPPVVARLTAQSWLALDVGVAALYTALAWWSVGEDLTSGWATAALVVLVSAPIAVARRHPLTGLVGALTALVLSPVAPGIAFAALPPAGYALYRTALSCPRTRSSAALVGAVVASIATALPDFEHRGAIAPFALTFVTTWSVGYAVRQQRAYGSRLVSHLEERASAELAQAKQQAAEERLLMARELHDVVAHSMTVVTVQASYGALIVDSRPEEARSAFTAIETTGRQALDEIRALMRVLRGADDPTAGGRPVALTPTPGLADIDALLTGAAQAGVAVQLRVNGKARALPLGIDLAAYRILQEALTNVVRHAGVDAAVAAVGYGSDELTIDVSDEGVGTTAREPGAGGEAHGILGMRERVTAYGGELRAGPAAGRGFVVSARLPLTRPGA